MSNRSARRLFTILGTVGTLTVFPAAAASAPPTPGQDFTDVYPAGIACDFELQVAGSGGKRHLHEYTDRIKETGTGSALTFTNLATDASVSLKSNGSVTRITFNPDGTLTFQVTGHSVLILFPTDVPAGPSTTLTAGQVVFDVDLATEVFTLKKRTGKQTDICALLS